MVLHALDDTAVSMVCSAGATPKVAVCPLDGGTAHPAAELAFHFSGMTRRADSDAVCLVAPEATRRVDSHHCLTKFGGLVLIPAKVTQNAVAPVAEEETVVLLFVDAKQAA